MSIADTRFFFGRPGDVGGRGTALGKAMWYSTAVSNCHCALMSPLGSRLRHGRLVVEWGASPAVVVVEGDVGQ